MLWCDSCVSCLVAEEERAVCFTSLRCGCLCSLSRLHGAVGWSAVCDGGIPWPEVIKLEFRLRLKIKRNDWLLVNTCPQAANQCPLF